MVLRKKNLFVFFVVYFEIKEKEQAMWQNSQSLSSYLHLKWYGIILYVLYYLFSNLHNFILF